MARRDSRIGDIPWEQGQILGYIQKTIILPWTCSLHAVSFHFMSDEKPKSDCADDGSFDGIGCMAVIGLVALTEGIEKLYGHGHAYLIAGTLILIAAAILLYARSINR